MRLLLLSFLLITLLGCKKFDANEIYEYEPIYVEYVERFTMSFPSVLGFSLPWVIDIPTMGATFEEKYKSNNPYIHLVENVKPIKVKVTLLDPVGEDFSFIKNKRVYIKAPGAPEVLMARADNLTDNVGNIMYMTPQSILLDDYMRKEMEMRIEIDADKSLLQEVNVLIELTVNAKIKN